MFMGPLVLSTQDRTGGSVAWVLCFQRHTTGWCVHPPEDKWAVVSCKYETSSSKRIVNGFPLVFLLLLVRVGLVVGRRWYNN